MNKKGFRSLQLIIMGFIAILIGPLVLLDAMLIHGLPFLDSISESATIANQTAPILPFCLGAFALFAFSYAKVLAYNKLDKVLPYIMFVGFTIVAMQMCNSDYITQATVGILGIPAFWSGVLHNIGALLGFGSLILWISLCFTESDRTWEEMTPRKRTRNKIYYTTGVLMGFSIILFLLQIIGAFVEGFPVIWLTEVIILTLGGISCVIKGGLFLKDKEKKEEKKNE